MVPVVAPVGTDVLMSESSVTVKVGWLVPLNATAEAPVSPVPVIVTAVPTNPLVGLKPVIVGVGDASTVNAAFALPPGAVTVIVPLVAPAGTIVLIWVSPLSVKVAPVVLNVTPDVPVNPDPVITTPAPITAWLGLTFVIEGGAGAVTVNDAVEVAPPPGVATVIGPLPPAPLGTVALICASLFTVKVGCDVPLKATPVALVNPDPEICTIVPTGPLAGLKLEIRGCTVNGVAEVAVPPGVVTLIEPVVAPVGTVVLMWESSVNVKAAVAPLNVTAETPVKWVPLIVTPVPSVPAVGLKLPIVGGGVELPNLNVAMTPVQPTVVELRVAE